jgi:hypothetical protein
MLAHGCLVQLSGLTDATLNGHMGRVLLNRPTAQGRICVEVATLEPPYSREVAVQMARLKLVEEKVEAGAIALKRQRLGEDDELALKVISGLAKHGDLQLSLKTHLKPAFTQAEDDELARKRQRRELARENDPMRQRRELARANANAAAAGSDLRQTPPVGSGQQPPASGRSVSPPPRMQALPHAAQREQALVVVQAGGDGSGLDGFVVDVVGFGLDGGGFGLDGGGNSIEIEAADTSDVSNEEAAATVLLDKLNRFYGIHNPAKLSQTGKDSVKALALWSAPWGRQTTLEAALVKQYGFGLESLPSAPQPVAAHPRGTRWSRDEEQRFADASVRHQHVSGTHARYEAIAHDVVTRDVRQVCARHRLRRRQTKAAPAKGMALQLKTMQAQQDSLARELKAVQAQHTVIATKQVQDAMHDMHASGSLQAKHAAEVAQAQLELQARAMKRSIETMGTMMPPAQEPTEYEPPPQQYAPPPLPVPAEDTCQKLVYLVAFRHKLLEMQQRYPLHKRKFGETVWNVPVQGVALTPEDHIRFFKMTPRYTRLRRDADQHGEVLTVVAACRFGVDATQWDAKNGPDGTLMHQTAIRELVREVVGAELMHSDVTHGQYEDWVRANGPGPIAEFEAQAVSYINGIYCAGLL